MTLVHQVYIFCETFMNHSFSIHDTISWTSPKFVGQTALNNEKKKLAFLVSFDIVLKFSQELSFNNRFLFDNEIYTNFHDHV